MGEIAAPFLLRLFINGNKRCATIGPKRMSESLVAILNNKQPTIPENHLIY